MSIVYVADLVHGMLTAACSPAAVGQTYFLANPEPVIWREFSLLVARVMGSPAVALPFPVAALRLTALAGDLIGKVRGSAALFRTEKFEEMRQTAWVCSTDKAQQDLQWTPSTPMDHLPAPAPSAESKRKTIIQGNRSTSTTANSL